MPIGKVKWYDPERGFGFVSNPGHEDVFVGKAVLPKGVTELHRGQRIEFDFGAGLKGPQALRVVVLEQPHTKAAKVERKYTAEQLGSMVGDLVNVLDGKIMPQLVAGRFPERKEGKQVAEILRVVAAELEA
ncbi:cold-shock protein [Corynebacterium sp. HS2168-gen11]|uniref:cold-shock protein n=1 Tax=Corynebacterium sp. HS2168-gen11 TaxID=2974027 RepID=UPI00216AE73D|nr:cold shock domain-containing protein [Corynebacterium sp. HS2168-gen11]MCS4536435.1 cold shock domain-containing protein [Corynebacterium sp. HS2168-gen11]